jgi:hypothetical protein
MMTTLRNWLAGILERWARALRGGGPGEEQRGGGTGEE